MPGISRRNFLAQALRVGGLLAIPGAVSWFISRFPPPATFRQYAQKNLPLLHPARWWKSACAGVQCTLCPFECFLPEGIRGICNVRMNVGGRLKTLVYAQPVSIHIDPIEKKPVYHFYPGSRSYSLATVGCNLKRAFCGLICPFGAWQAFFGKINPYRVSIIGEKCTRCQRCVVACPTFAIEKGIGDSPQKEGTVPNLLSYCNRCGECMDVCSSGAIDYAVGWGRRNFFVGGAARVLFLISAWLVGGAVSLLFVPEVMLKIWEWVLL